ncbi:Hypothetical protein NTJ_11034 [Nesidiocoris tenuis]|uniref:Uncharacterized protein n=1 Tax=Nesidiocoris tenuis TaxID=355587 RepID=A0ABN7B3P2_9HEMI|nr:Hypothetical protein NTJ_11034 [Nesidiocoris tenuis]
MNTTEEEKVLRTGRVRRTASDCRSRLSAGRERKPRPPPAPGATPNSLRARGRRKHLPPSVEESHGTGYRKSSNIGPIIGDAIYGV